MPALLIEYPDEVTALPLESLKVISTKSSVGSLESLSKLLTWPEIEIESFRS